MISPHQICFMTNNPGARVLCVYILVGIIESCVRLVLGVGAGGG